MRLRVLPVLQRLVPSLAGIADDIKKPGVSEFAYDRMPLKALYSLTRLWRVTTDDLAKVTQPVLLFRSSVDHVVEAGSSRRVLAAISSRDVTETLLDDSYHVADARQRRAADLRRQRGLRHPGDLACVTTG